MASLSGSLFPVGNDGCGPVSVVVKTVGGRGGDPAYAGGWIDGHTGHAASMMSAGQMRLLASALLQAAEAIDASGLPSCQQAIAKRREAGRI